MFKKLVDFLHKENKIKHKLLQHKIVYTALDKAKTLNVQAQKVLKSLVVKAGNKYYLVVLPADKNLDLNKLKQKLNQLLKKNKGKLVDKVEIVKENWIKKNIKGVKIGNIVPFGFFWKLPTIVDKSVLKIKNVIINSGDYDKSIELPSSVFKKISGLIILSGISIKKKVADIKQKRKNKQKQR